MALHVPSTSAACPPLASTTADPPPGPVGATRRRSRGGSAHGPSRQVRRPTSSASRPEGGLDSPSTRHPTEATDRAASDRPLQQYAVSQPPPEEFPLLAQFRPARTPGAWHPGFGLWQTISTLGTVRPARTPGAWHPGVRPVANNFHSRHSSARAYPGAWHPRFGLDAPLGGTIQWRRTPARGGLDLNRRPAQH